MPRMVPGGPHTAARMVWCHKNMHTPQIYMGILGSLYSRDFGDPVVILGTPFSDTDGTTLKTCQVHDG